MLLTNEYLISFWITPWSDPFRAACLWFTAETQPLRGRKLPNTIAPRWLRPFFLQRWVGEAIAARLASNPLTRAYRYGQESQPDWEAVNWPSYTGRVLRHIEEEALLRLFNVEVERLLRIAQEHPSMDQLGWTGGALSASEHIAQVYAELRRRCKAARARALLSEELRRFVAWPVYTP